MKNWLRQALLILTCLMLTVSCCAAAHGEAPERVSPAESFYGYVNQDYFAAFDSGIEGAYVDPVYGELIAPDPETTYQYSGDMDIITNALNGTLGRIREDLFSGKTETEPSSPGRKILDLYDVLKNAEADREADDALFMKYVQPFLNAKTPEELFWAAETLYLDTGISVLFDVNVSEERETNQALPMVCCALSLLGAKIAYDPESAECYALPYQAAMGDYMRALGHPADETALAEAYRLQSMRYADQALYNEYNSARFDRAHSPETGAVYASYDADTARLRELHADPNAAVPEGLSPGDEAVYRELVSTGLIGHIARGKEEVRELPEGKRLIHLLETAGYACDQVIIRPSDLEVMKTEFITEENLEAWRINAVLMIAEKLDYIPAVAEDAWRRMRRTAECAMWGDDSAPETQAQAQDDEALQSRALELLPMEYALLWAEENDDPALEMKARDMFEKLRSAYIVRIQKNTWLEDAEKAMCIRKLENMELVIGLPTEDNYVFAQIIPRSEGGTLLTNRVQLSRQDLMRNRRLVNEEGYNRKAFDQELFHSGFSIDMRNVNAGGNTAYNSVVLPAWFITYAVDPASDEIELWGTLGAFIAHEISHNFDQRGARHDENGAFRNWWSEETYEKLYEIRDRFETHFEKTDIIRGQSREFYGEMGECFADFSGIQLVLDVTGDDPDTQRTLLESWAGSYAFLNIISRAQLEQMVEFEMFTNHPMGAQRINGIISALNCFYDLYDVKEGDPMYTSPEDRLDLW